MAFRGREFIFYWITVKEQISTQHASPNVQKGTAYLKARPFLSSLVSWSHKNISLAKLAMAAPDTLHREQQSGFPGRRGSQTICEELEYQPQT